MSKVVHTETIAGKGWNGDDIVDVVSDLSLVFKPDERIVVISEDEYNRLCEVERKYQQLANWSRTEEK